MLSLVIACTAVLAGVGLLQKYKNQDLQAYTKKKLPYLHSGELRKKQIQKITQYPQKITKEEREVKRALQVSGANLGVVALSFLYPPLVLLVLPGLIYTVVPIYKLAYQQPFKERRPTSNLLQAILMSGVLLAGFLKIGAISAFIFMAGRKLLFETESKAKHNLVNLFGEHPPSVWVMLNGVEIEVPFEGLKKGDVLIVSASQTIPVDGIILKGSASIDQSALTGESQPAEKGAGDSVLAATIVLAGKIYIEAQKTGQATVAMQVGEILNNTADFRMLTQSRGEAIADRLVLPTLCISAVVWPVFGVGSSLSILNNEFGYKMRLFAPASALCFLNLASQQGILIKDGRSLDLLADIDTVVFDKTGTLTVDQPIVNKIYTFTSIQKNDVLRYAAIAEYRQIHPIAYAILDKANECQLDLSQVDNSKYKVGYGIQVSLKGRIIHVGSERFMNLEEIHIPSQAGEAQKNCYQKGHTFVMVAINQNVIGGIELEATVRPEIKQIIQSLHKRNISVCIMSGDSEQPTKKVAKKLGIDHYFANILPENKAKLVKQLQEKGKKVCFVGDGINDSIALKKADVSISLRGAATAATDTAQIILMDGTLKNLSNLFEISRQFEKNMGTNLLLSTVPSFICLSGVLFFSWGFVAGSLISNIALFTGIGNTLLPIFGENRKSDS